MDCSFLKDIVGVCNGVCKQIFNLYAHTVAVISLHLSKKNNPLLKWYFLERADKGLWIWTRLNISDPSFVRFPLSDIISGFSLTSPKGLSWSSWQCTLSVSGQSSKTSPPKLQGPLHQICHWKPWNHFLTLKSIS